MPHFAGPFMVDTSGRIELISPQEALKHPVLEDNMIFPERLTRLRVLSHQYRLGVANRLFLHDDQIQIQDISSDNRQPFLMSTEEGLNWFISTEPYGASHGIFKIFLTDARTGTMQIYELLEDEVLTGPVRASDYVRQSNPVVDWTRFIMAEPLPFVRNGILYWKVAVIPEDAAGIAYQAFVDSRSNQVVELRSSEDIRLFVRGEIEALPGEQQDMEGIIEEMLEKIDELESLVEDLLRLR